MSTMIDRKELNSKKVSEIMDLIKQNPNLQTLDLSDNRFEDKDFQSIINGIPDGSHLTDLNLSKNKLSVQSVETFISLFKKCPNLQSMDLENSGFGPTALQTFVEGIPKNSGLIHLELGRCFLGRSALAISKLLQAAPSLQDLGLSDNLMGDEGVQALAQGLPAVCNLRSIALGENSLGLRSPKALVTIIQKCPNLEELDLSNNRDLGLYDGQEFLAISQHRNLTSLNLRDCQLDVQNIPGLAVLLQVLKLKLLNLRANNLGDKGVQALAKVLAKDRSLTHLNLYYNGISSKDGLKIIAELSAQNRTLSKITLQERRWRDNPVLLEVIKNNLTRNTPQIRALERREFFLASMRKNSSSSLHTLFTLGKYENRKILNLIWKFLGINIDEKTSIYIDFGITYLGKSPRDISTLLQKNPELQKLDFHRYKLGNKGVKELAQELPSVCNLRSIVLKGNALDSKSYKALVTIIKKCPNLQELDLSNNWCVDLKKSQVFLALSQYPSLTSLNLASCSLNSKSISGLAVLFQTQKLKVLNLAHNKIGYSGIQTLAKSLASNRSLTHLTLDFNHISSSTLEVIVELSVQNRTLSEIGFQEAGLTWEQKVSGLLEVIKNNLRRNTPQIRNSERLAFLLAGIRGSHSPLNKLFTLGKYENRKTLNLIWEFLGINIDKRTKLQFAIQGQEQKETKSDAKASDTSMVVKQESSATKPVVFSKPDTICEATTSLVKRMPKGIIN